jgi:hypothetical protein
VTASDDEEEHREERQATSRAPRRRRSGNEELLRSAWPWVVRNPIPALPILGVLLYGIQRLGAAVFYGRMGFTPEDVGFGYASGISQAVFGGLGFATAFLLFPFALGLPVAGISLLRSLWFMARRNPRGARAWKRARSHIGEIRRTWYEEIVSTIVLLGFLSFPLVSAMSSGDEAAAGHPHPPGAIPTESWSATASQIHLLQPVSGLLDGQCLLFLGEGDGYVALYDPARSEGWRVPVSSVAINTGGALGLVDRVPNDCPP